MNDRRRVTELERELSDLKRKVKIDEMTCNEKLACLILAMKIINGTVERDAAILELYNTYGNDYHRQKIADAKKDCNYKEGDVIKVIVTCTPAMYCIIAKDALEAIGEETVESRRRKVESNE